MQRSPTAWVAPLTVAMLIVLALSLCPTDAGARPESTRVRKIELLKAFPVRFGAPPDLIILGSSRSMRADPAVLRARLRARAFNAGVGSGTLPDALAFVRLARSLYPEQPFGVLWLLDIESLRLSGLSPYTLSVPELVAALPPGARPEDGRSTPTSERRPTYNDPRSRWEPDGFLSWCLYDYERLHGQTTAMRVPYQLSCFRLIYPSRVPDGMTGWSKWFVKQVVREANEMGVTPVIVLTPYHPELRRFIAARGWVAVHRAVLRYLNGLRSEFSLRLVDFTSVASFRGWPNGFYDGMHARPVMMRRLLNVLVNKAGTLLLPPTPTPTPTPAPTPTPTPTPTLPPTPTPTPSPTPASASTPADNSVTAPQAD